MNLTFPKMILFDYGQTLCTEPGYDPIAGIEAVLRHSENPNDVTPQDICALGDKLNAETNRFAKDPHEMLLELPAIAFERFLYDWFGIRFLLPRRQIEKLYWDAAAPGTAAPHIGAALAFLRHCGVRTGVISNLSYTGETLAERICECIPAHSFEFIMASSDYIFRKPSPNLYGVALKKAGLSAEDVWFAGDNTVCDVEGPHECGLTAIWYKGALRHSTKPPACPHLALDDWRELEPLLLDLCK